MAGRLRMQYLVSITDVESRAEEDFQGYLEDVAKLTGLSPSYVRLKIQMAGIPCAITRDGKVYTITSRVDPVRKWRLDYTTHSPSLSGETCTIAESTTLSDIAERSEYSYSYVAAKATKACAESGGRFTINDRDDSLGHFIVSLVDADA